jgi:hypothetical protein
MHGRTTSQRSRWGRCTTPPRSAVRASASLAGRAQAEVCRPRRHAGQVAFGKRALSADARFSREAAARLAADAVPAARSCICKVVSGGSDGELLFVVPCERVRAVDWGVVSLRIATKHHAMARRRDFLVPSESRRLLRQDVDADADLSQHVRSRRLRLLSRPLGAELSATTARFTRGREWRAEFTNRERASERRARVWWAKDAFGSVQRVTIGRARRTDRADGPTSRSPRS